MGAAGIERVEAFFGGRAFEPHRHDTYAIGVTTRGVQIFNYRGAQRCCLPGQLHVVHPDDIHDGGPATGLEPWRGERGERWFRHHKVSVIATVD